MIKILTIEENEIGQTKLKFLLESLCYESVNVTNFQDAASYLEFKKPLLIIASINHVEGYNFDYFKLNNPHCPIIFTTDLVNKNIIDQILSIQNASFLLKPFQEMTVYAAIKSSLKAIEISNNIQQEDTSFISIPIHYGQKTNILFASIYCIEVEGNYSTIHTHSQRYVQKISFSKIIPQLDERFIQIHKSVIINKTFVTNVNLVKDFVMIKDKTFNIGRSFRRNFIQKFYEGAK